MWASVWTSAQATEPIYIWQGFDQNWKYNHRVARLGDWIEEQNGEMWHHHSAASGTGGDRATYSSTVSVLHGSALQGRSQFLEVDLIGHEGETIREEMALDCHLDSALGQEQEVAVLSGFEIEALAAADKLEILEISIGNGESDRPPLRVEMRANCDSAECRRRDNSVQYRLRVHVLCLGTEADWAIHNTTMERDQAWSRRQGQGQRDDVVTLQGTSGDQYPTAIVGWQGFRLELNSSMHMLAWESQFELGEYSAESGEQQMTIGLGFSQWKRGMKWPHIPMSWFAFRESGSAKWQADVVLLQLATGRVETVNPKGELKWPGRNQAASDPRAHRSQLLVPSQ